MTGIDPLTPRQADLSGMDYMPVYGEMLRTSDFNSRATDAEFRAAFNLWWSAWLQVPAASLPNDERALCALAGLGRDMKSWRKVRDVVMEKFILCTDGRWYHPVLAPIAINAWNERLAAIKRGRLSGVARRLRRGLPTEPSTPQTPESVSRQPQDEVVNGLETQTNKEKEKEKNTNTAVEDSNSPASYPVPAGEGVNPTPNPERIDRIMRCCKAARVVDHALDNPVILRWIELGIRDGLIEKALTEGRMSLGTKTMTVAYVNAILQRLVSEDSTTRAAAALRVSNTASVIEEQRTWAAAPKPEGFPTVRRNVA